MRQPDIGLKVAELRLSKQLTQEELAQDCEVSTRTIQRIESGEVDPRIHTLSVLSEVLEYDFGSDDEGRENVWLAALHVSTMFLWLIVPIVVWSLKKPVNAKIDAEGRQVLNFQITWTLVLLTWVVLLVMLPALGLWIAGDAGTFNAIDESGLTAAFIIVFTTIPPIAIGIFCMYQGVVNAVRSLGDGEVRYPLSIPFVK